MESENKNELYYNSLAVDIKQRHRDSIYDKQSLNICECVIRSIIGSIKIDEPIRWLDVGCGLGHVAEVSKKIGAIYVGVDISQANIAACSHKYKYEFMRGDFITLPIKEKFHLITFFSSLHHFPDWRAAVEKSLSLIDKKGAIYIEHEPVRLFSKLYLYSLYIRLGQKSLAGLKDIEIHGMAKHSILPQELPPGRTEYHFDFIPFFRNLHFRTSNPVMGGLFSHYRKIIIIDEKLT